MGISLSVEIIGSSSLKKMMTTSGFEGRGELVHHLVYVCVLFFFLFPLSLSCLSTPAEKLSNLILI